MINLCIFQYFSNCKLYASSDIYSCFMLESGDNTPCNRVFRSRDIDNNTIRVSSYNTILYSETKDKKSDRTTDIDTDSELVIFSHS